MDQQTYASEEEEEGHAPCRFQVREVTHTDVFEVPHVCSVWA